MTWNKETAHQRIRDLKRTFVDTLSEEVLHQSHRSLNEVDFAAYDRARTLKESPNFLNNLGSDESRVVDGVHVYAKLLDYDDILLGNGAETEQSHKRLLAFLNLHYAIADRVIKDVGALRVDYHGGRLHAVVMEPFDNEQGRLLAAIQLCRLLQAVAVDAVREYGETGMGARLRFGIDSGKCVAISNASVRPEKGGKIESDPLFLGSAANEAAKLAEAPHTEGIFLTDRARLVLDNSFVKGSVINNLSGLKEAAFDFRDADEFASNRSESIMKVLEADNLTDLFENKRSTDFTFHQHIPPLSSIKFKDLSPSRSIRMGICSIFADLDGYTNYVDQCVENGSVREAVRDIQIIRSELGLVLRKDFEGKKVRFIGDCIQGAIARGTSSEINPSDTVRQALLCSGGMRSSFELCQEELPSTKALGLAIGIEYGPAPISRIGSGAQSVRVASAKVVAASEEEQRKCDGKETALGPIAYNILSPSTKIHFPSNRTATGLNYGILISLGLLSVASPAVATVDDDSSGGNDASPSIEPPTAPPFRPHSM